MEQKQMYLLYFLFGTSCLLMLGSCDEEVDYRVRADWVYINETDQIVTLVDRGTAIPPTDSTVFNTDTEGPKQVSEEQYVPPFSSMTVRFGDDQCMSYEAGTSPGEGEGILGTASYQSTKIADRYYRFTYHFTTEKFTRAQDCN